jgi:hypothetical protein
MNRGLFNFLTVLSLLLCVAVAGLWVRSYTDEVRMDWGGSINGGMGWQGYDQSLIASRGALLYVRSFAPDGSAGQRVAGRWGRFGFLVARGKGAYAPGATAEACHVTIGLPFWALAAVAAFAPATLLRRRRHQRLRRQLGHCPRCGYDLRATPGRCPECGTEANGLA